MPRRNGFDIVVAGAGPVGLMFAARLAGRATDLQCRIHVLDVTEPKAWDARSVDPRVYALSRESQRLFDDLGLWQVLQARRVSPYRCMRVWEGDDPRGIASIGFDAAEIGEPDLGHIVEDSLLRACLLDFLGGTDVSLRFGCSLRSLQRRDGRTLAVTDDGETIKADLVVGADGVDSVVRDAAGIATIRRDYSQTAVVAHVTTELDHRETAWQRFLPGGPLAFLPLRDGRSSIVWSSPSADADRLCRLADDAFLAELETASSNVLGSIDSCTQRHRFPLRLLHAVRYVGDGIALIGDSAHAVHPLAGQGMNLGLSDAAHLCNTVVDAARSGRYPGDRSVLRRYERIQKAHNLGMQIAFDGLNRLFRHRRSDWAGPVRRFGMAAVDCAGPAKRLLMRRALGLDRLDAVAVPPAAASGSAV